MTDERDELSEGDYWTDDELQFDEELSRHLRASLDVAGPSEEAQDRMLAHLLAAQAAREQQLASESDPAVQTAASPAYKRSEETVVTVKRFEIPEAPKDDEEPIVISGGRARESRRKRQSAVRRRYVGFGVAAAASLLIAFLGVSFALSSKDASSNAATSELYVQTDAAASEKAEAAGSAAAPEAVYESNADTGYANELPETEEAAEDTNAIPLEEELLASGGAFDVTADPSYPYACTYQEIQMRTGEVLRIEEHNGGPVLIDPIWVEDLLGEATAVSQEDDFDVMPCWVYRLPVSDDGLYVVRYLQGGTFYAARVIDEGLE